MQKLRNICLSCLILSVLFGSAYLCVFVSMKMSEEHFGAIFEDVSKNSWVEQQTKYSRSFYKTSVAENIGNNIVLLQAPSGGWGKNINFDKKFNFFDEYYINSIKSTNINPTIDNSATTTQIDYLAKLYQATKNIKYRTSALKGLQYLLDMQMSNGGFPQAYPFTKESYQEYITYNDKAMINVLTLFKRIVEKDKLFDFVPLKMRNQIERMLKKGIDCILKTQLEVGIWSAQYEPKTLKPAPARIYEPVALDTRESADIVLFLMNIKLPDEQIISAVKKAVNWFEQHKITDKVVMLYIDDKGQKDLKIVKGEGFGMWGRFYDIQTQKIIFSDRTGQIFDNFDYIERERKIGYDWFTYKANKVLQKYPLWINSLRNN